MAERELDGRIALVTGGTGGIGTAICRHLAKLGHKVATNYLDEAKTKAWQEAQVIRYPQRTVAERRHDPLAPPVSCALLLAGKQGVRHGQHGAERPEFDQLLATSNRACPTSQRLR